MERVPVPGSEQDKLVRQQGYAETFHQFEYNTIIYAGILLSLSLQSNNSFEIHARACKVCTCNALVGDTCVTCVADNAYQQPGKTPEQLHIALG